MDLSVRAMMIGMVFIPCICMVTCGVTLLRRQRHALGGALLVSGVAWMILPFVSAGAMILLPAGLFTVGALWAAWLRVDDEWASGLVVLAGMLTVIFVVALLKQISRRVFRVESGIVGPVGVLFGIGVTISFVILKRARARARSRLTIPS
jgi:hypothetical protein